MAARFAYVDVHFFHKNTANTLLEEFGPGGPLMFLALILQCKNSRPAGQFTWTGEADAFQQLFGGAVLPEDLPFTFSEFLKTTGRLKQTRVAKTDRRRRGQGADRARTGRGRVAHVALTRWEDWQKESRTWSERERKSRKRGETEADTTRDSVRNGSGHDADDKRTHPPTRSIPITNPPTPRETGHNPRAKRTNPRQRTTARYQCPHCQATQRTQGELDDHIKYVHYDQTTT